MSGSELIIWGSLLILLGMSVVTTVIWWRAQGRGTARRGLVVLMFWIATSPWQLWDKLDAWRYRRRQVRQLREIGKRLGGQIMQAERIVKDKPLTDRLLAMTRDPYMQEIDAEIDALIRGQM